MITWLIKKLKMILTGHWKNKKPTPTRLWSIIKLQKFNDFPVLISWAKGEDLKIEFTDPGEYSEDEIRAEVMKIIDQEMGEIADADLRIPM